MVLVDHLDASKVVALGMLGPLAVAAMELRQSRPRGLVHLCVGGLLLLVYGVRLGDPSLQLGFVRLAGLSSSEFESSQLLGSALLSLFGLSYALGATKAMSRATVFRLRGALNGFSRWRLFRSSYTAMLVALILCTVAGLALTFAEEMLQLLHLRGMAQMIWFLGACIPAVFLMRRRPLLAGLSLAWILAIGFSGNNRQGLLTPVVMLLLAGVATFSRPEPLNARTVVRSVGVCAVVGTVLLASVMWITDSRRAESSSALYQSAASGPLELLIRDQVILDVFYVALAREDVPQGPGIFLRTLAAPIPRVLWPAKPVSYDFALREEHFPSFGGATPIGIVGTSYLVGYLPGVLVAGWLLGRLGRASAHLVDLRTPQAVLVSGALTIFAADLIRIGGLYRETVVLAATLAGILLVVPRSAQPPDGNCADPITASPEPICRVTQR